ncbi:HAD family hydrolase [Vibrio pelagius]|uniref:HAD family hydrolase n=1 Tax=Vibrio pelagius TaxID=28169 RepID=UPI00354F6586
MKIVVFDVCGTLYRSNTTFDFLDYYFKDNSRYKLFRTVSKTTIAKIFNFPFFRFLKLDLIRMVAISFLKGEDLVEISESAQTFLDSNLHSKIQQPVYDIYSKYKNEGYHIILMSGSLDFLIEMVKDRWGADDAYSTILQLEKGKFTGKISFEQLFNKYDVLTENYCKIDELVVVSDNPSDLDLLSKADKGYAICNKDKNITFWKKKKSKNILLVDLT